MDKQRFNILCAEYMGLDKFPYVSDILKTYCYDKETMELFNPYEDANDRNKVIEKMRVTVFCFAEPAKWKSYVNQMPGDFISESRDESEIACISAVLESEQ